jgi:TRAP-type C4-dicarboxylate transport system substrate-binding protein
LLRKGYLDETLTRDVKVISLNLTETLKIWTTKPVQTLAELKGLQLRVSGGLDAKAVEALGAVPIMMPLPEMYPALSKGVISGVVTGITTGMDFKLHEATKYIMDVPASIAVHMHIMNKKLWNSLSLNTQQILEQIFRENETHWSVTIDTLESRARAVVRERFGVNVYEPPASEVEKIRNATKGVTDEWIAEMEKKGLPGRKTYEAMLESMRNNGIILDQTWVTNRAVKK